MFKDSDIILDAIRGVILLPNQQQQQYLPQIKSILDGQFSRQIPIPFRLEIEITT